jgi:hypothetical protein
MKKHGLLIASIAFVVAAVGIFYLQISGKLPVVVERVESVGTAGPPIARGISAPAPVIVAAEVSAPVAQTPSIAEQFKRATDYLDFSNSVVERARAGDGDAQYYLYAVLQYCDENYRMYFRRRDRRTRTLDEALNRVSTRPAERVEVVRLAYDRCSRMFDGGAQPFGAAKDWLEQAARNDQPLALVAIASRNLFDSSPDLEAPKPYVDPGPALVKALRTKDPEVIWRIGEIQPLLVDDEHEQTVRTWAWWLVACERGFDCEQSAWMEYNCRFDQMCAQDRNATDFIRRMTDLDFPEVEARAKDINASIDSGSWDALGLGAGGFDSAR